MATRKPVSKSKKVQLNQKWRKRLVPFAGVLIIAGIGTYLLNSIFAENIVQPFSLYATHPYASRAGFDANSVNYYTGQKLCATTFCPTGQAITDMEVSAEGQLVAGYGDWNANVDSFGVPEGRVGVVPLDLNTNTWGPITVAGSESLDNFRKINGKIYTTTTDPSDTLGSKSGYITNESGTWQLKQDNANGIHIFDVATFNGTDRWETGAGQGGAAAYRSINNDGVWTPTVSVAGDWARWYWAGNINGKLYIGSLANNTTYGTAGTQVFDGTSWTKSNIEPCGTTLPKLVVTYEGKIVCPPAVSTANAMSVFDGSRVNNITITGQARDFYVDGTTLYMLNTSGAVYRFTSLTSAPVLVGQGGSQANTVAVYNGYMYLGYPAGQIYRSNGVIGTPAPAPTAGTMTAIATSPNPLALDRAKKIITIDGTGFPSGVTVTVGGQATTLVSSTATKINVEFDTAKYIRTNHLRTTTTVTLSVTVSAAGYTTVTAPSITANYVK